MSVDTRAHITSATLQYRVVVRRTQHCASGKAGYRYYKAIGFQGHSGDEVRLLLSDLGDALRVLGIKPADLGYKPPRPRKAAPVRRPAVSDLGEALRVLGIKP